MDIEKAKEQACQKCIYNDNCDFPEHGKKKCAAYTAKPRPRPPKMEIGYKEELVTDRIEQLEKEKAGQAAEIERLVDLFERLRIWSNAYPLSAFPRPDYEKARKLLKAGGMTLDAISADNMRHVLEGVKDIVDKALNKEAAE